MTQSASTPAAGSIDPAEVAKFSGLADAWWDPAGKFRPLNRLNPTRIAYIRDRAAARYGREPIGPAPLAGLAILDIGCGGGLLSEPLARLGGKVTGLDAAERNIAIAKRHAELGGLAIDYRAGSAEDLAASGRQFDVVLAMEVVEHVADPASFLGAAAALVAPGGLLIVATLNRTAKAFALAIVGAEYILGWLPRGSHDWRRFLKPSELAALLRPHGLTLGEAVGVVYSPIADKWRLAPGDLDVNYMLRFDKA
jgi:2-polyprenyl-6-hydroxyphenyl methylase/3-demethylubiquinone-9 3-methyltransferase